MSAVDTAQPPPRASRGLAVRLFAALIVLGAFAVLMTGGIGYLRARDSLEISIINKLTAVRETKERQVETYFRTIGNDLRLLATSKMVLEAVRDFRAAYAELDQGEPAPELRRKVDDWYATVFLPPLQRVLGNSVAVADLLPVGAAAYHLQYQYIVANPQPANQRKLIDDAGDGSAYSRTHAIFHPLMRNAAATVGFFDMMLADPKTGRILYAVEKETDFATSLRIGPHRQSNVAAAVARCAVAPDRATLCLEDFAPYIPSGGAPTPSWRRRCSTRVSWLRS